MRLVWRPTPARHASTPVPLPAPCGACHLGLRDGRPATFCEQLLSLPDAHRMLSHSPRFLWNHLLPSSVSPHPEPASCSHWSSAPRHGQPVSSRPVFSLQSSCRRPFQYTYPCSLPKPSSGSPLFLGQRPTPPLGLQGPVDLSDSMPRPSRLSELQIPGSLPRPSHKGLLRQSWGEAPLGLRLLRLELPPTSLYTSVLTPAPDFSSSAALIRRLGDTAHLDSALLFGPWGQPASCLRRKCVLVPTVGKTAQRRVRPWASMTMVPWELVVPYWGPGWAGGPRVIFTDVLWCNAASACPRC